MTHKLFRALAPLVLVLAAAAIVDGGDAKKDAKKDPATIDGTWIPSTAQLGGKEFPEEVRKTIQLVVKDGKYLVVVGKVEDRGTVKLDAAAKPKALDLTGTDGPNKGKTYPCIYERDGDNLKVCYDLSGKARPTEFVSTPGTLLFLVTYMRQKD